MKLEFHYTYILVALGFILTGFFSNLIIFTSIIIIHELGHYTIAKLNKLKVSKIIIYPYGGLLKMNNPINIDIAKELQVALSGIIFQELFFFLIYILYKNNLIREYIFNLFTIYNKSILLFNILPIYPLDGSKILTLLFSKFIPYKLSNQINIIISIITISFLFINNYYHLNYTIILIIIIIINNLVEYYKELDYLVNKFLLERYLYHFRYHQVKKISNIDHMYREKSHVIKGKDGYITEKVALKLRFERKN